jgi:hypothetical protein
MCGTLGVWYFVHVIVLRCVAHFLAMDVSDLIMKHHSGSKEVMPLLSHFFGGAPLRICVLSSSLAVGFARQAGILHERSHSSILHHVCDHA